MPLKGFDLDYTGSEHAGADPAHEQTQQREINTKQPWRRYKVYWGPGQKALIWAAPLRSMPAPIHLFMRLSTSSTRSSGESAHVLGR
eukprot:3929948-Rhodomonas_salina.1